MALRVLTDAESGREFEMDGKQLMINMARPQVCACGCGRLCRAHRCVGGVPGVGVYHWCRCVSYWCSTTPVIVFRCLIFSFVPQVPRELYQQGYGWQGGGMGYNNGYGFGRGGYGGFGGRWVCWPVAALADDLCALHLLLGHVGW